MTKYLQFFSVLKALKFWYLRQWHRWSAERGPFSIFSQTGPAQKFKNLMLYKNTSELRFSKYSFQQYSLRSVDCDRPRRVICQQNPLSYLDVQTELLLITDGRSNDPNSVGITLEEMKRYYTQTDINVRFSNMKPNFGTQYQLLLSLTFGRVSRFFFNFQVSAIGVGRINEQEIRELTDDQEGHIFYLMSWESVKKFNRIFEKVSRRFEHQALCYPKS